MKLKPYLLLLPLVLAACGGNDSDDLAFKDAAVVATRTSNFSSGAISVVDASSPYAAANRLNGTGSDIVVRGDGDQYFLINRSDATIKRYDASAPTTARYTYSTDGTGDTDSNPYDLIVVSATKGYLIRYGSPKLWIVNPSATREADFKINEINLSAYDSAGAPQMSAGVIQNGKLYVALQRLDGSFAATLNGYVAVIDTATDTEINTGVGAGGLKGIPLPVRDPIRLLAVPGSNAILVVADGGYNGNFVQQYEGGIVRINTQTYGTTRLVDDGTADNHPYGYIADAVVASADRAYFIGSTGFGGTQTLFRFKPGATDTPVPVAGYVGKDLGSLGVDPEGKLWIGRTSSATPGLTVLGFQGGAETIAKDLINTELIPQNIDFISVPTND
ncbi:MAG: hypothetical protein ACREVL_01880 [Solimonas sp.]